MSDRWREPDEHAVRVMRDSSIILGKVYGRPLAKSGGKVTEQRTSLL